VERFTKQPRSQGKRRGQKENEAKQPRADAVHHFPEAIASDDGSQRGRDAEGGKLRVGHAEVAFQINERERGSHRKTEIPNAEGERQETEIAIGQRREDAAVKRAAGQRGNGLRLAHEVMNDDIRHAQAGGDCKDDGEAARLGFARNGVAGGIENLPRKDKTAERGRGGNTLPDAPGNARQSGAE